jgi:hypothetical protein
MRDTLNHVQKEFYTESEAAEILEISIPRLRILLERHIFNDGTTPPQDLAFTYADLVLLDYWNNRPKTLTLVAANNQS